MSEFSDRFIEYVVQVQQFSVHFELKCHFHEHPIVLHKKKKFQIKQSLLAGTWLKLNIEKKKGPSTHTTVFFSVRAFCGKIQDDVDTSLKL